MDKILKMEIYLQDELEVGEEVSEEESVEESEEEFENVE
jgi:hypothetical protein